MIQRFSGCETKINCLLPSLCRRCCDDQSSFMRGDKITCNLQPQTYTHQCYRCDDCVLVSSSVLANQTNCMSEGGEKRSCFIYRNDEISYRGCYYEEAHELNDRLQMCQDEPENCKVCQGHLCNGDDLTSYCYQCSARNHQCKYDQQLAGHLQWCADYNFTSPFDVGSKPGCYSVD